VGVSAQQTQLDLDAVDHGVRRLERPLDLAIIDHVRVRRGW